MPKRLWILALVASLLLSGGIAATQAAAPAQQATASITSFTSTTTSVDRAALVNRTARIPVTWATANRPNTSNLVFEQVLPNGQSVNVELPRDNTYVPSSGNGVVAPMSPGDGVNEIHIRVTLLDVIKVQTYDQKEIVIPVTTAPAPVIRTFSTTAANVSRGTLDNHTARLPVSWQVDNRPDGSNLVFEQVLDNNSSVNVELPRSNPFVTSSGVGVVAPQPPGGSGTSITLRLRLVNLADNSTLAQKDIPVPIVDGPPNQPLFNVFSTTATSVSRASLTDKSARIPVSWQVYNRPANSNLVFEQVLDDGSVINVELPRNNPFVDDQGAGVVAPVPPGSSASVKLQVRLIDLGTKTELAKQQLTVPITESNASAAIRTFTTTATSVNRALLTNKTERVPVTFAVDNRPPNSNLVFEQVMSDNSAVNVELPRNNPIVPSSGVGVAAPVLPTGTPAPTSITLRLRLIDLSTQATLAQQTLTVPIAEPTAPTIALFNTPLTSVSQAALANKSARVPINFQVYGRYAGTNLVFEQVLADNSVVNVELPRSNPIIPDFGVGVVAPVPPGGTATSITLRLSVIDLTTKASLVQQTITVPINANATVPVISTFSTSAISVSRAELNNKTARIPVAFAVDNRPDNSNLVFEQVLDNGSVVNAELPRTTPIIPSSGNGVVAPVAPTNAGTTSITLRLRVIDLASQATLVQQTINLPINENAPSTGIRSFTTTLASIDYAGLANNSARIPVSWQVDTRPANSNLVFEQVLPDGSVVNVELPRNNPIVPSSGTGIAAAVAPGGFLQTNVIVLRLRLVNLGNNSTISQMDMNVSISGDATPFVQNVDQTQCYSSGFNAGVGLIVSGRGRVSVQAGSAGVPVLSAPRNGQIVTTLPSGATFTVSEGPTCFRYAYARPWTQLYWRMWKIKTESGNTEGWVPEYQVIGNNTRVNLESLSGTSTGGNTSGGNTSGGTPVQITSFNANPSPATRSGTVTLTWAVTGSVSRVQITLLSAGGSSTVNVVDNQPAQGTVSYTLTGDYINEADFTLSAYDANGQETDQDLAVPISCPFSSSLSEDCPVLQATGVNSAYQKFEKGQMVWRSDTKKIEVLYDDGSWTEFDDTWTAADGQTPGSDAPSGLFRPEHGFGKVWTQVGGAAALGWATTAEQSYSATWETHELIEGGVVTGVPHFTLPDGTVIHTGDHWTTG